MEGVVDIFTKDLQRQLFDDFRLNLNIREPLVSTMIRIFKYLYLTNIFYIPNILIYIYLTN